MGNKKKFGRVRNQRKALFKGLAFNLIMRGKIKTTAARAKELKRYIERMVTYAKKQKNLELQKFFPKTAVARLVKEIAPKYAGRKGGYVRVIKIPPRKGDAAEMSYIEFLSS